MNSFLAQGMTYFGPLAMTYGLGGVNGESEVVVEAAPSLLQEGTGRDVLLAARRLHAPRTELRAERAPREQPATPRATKDRLRPPRTTVGKPKKS